MKIAVTPTATVLLPVITSEFSVKIVAAVELGRGMGIAPAFRGEKITSGVYGVFNHPMYSGYAIAELGNILLNPLNGIIFLFSVAGYVARAKLEAKEISWGLNQL